MFDHKIFGRGSVTYDSFGLDPARPLVDQADQLTEDLLQVAYANDVVLDVGWYPAFSPTGHFRVVVVTECIWEEPRFDRRCGNLQELVEIIQRGVKMAEWLAERRDLQ